MANLNQECLVFKWSIVRYRAGLEKGMLMQNISDANATEVQIDDCDMTHTVAFSYFGSFILFGIINIP